MMRKEGRRGGSGECPTSSEKARDEVVMLAHFFGKGSVIVVVRAVGSFNEVDGALGFKGGEGGGVMYSQEGRKLSIL